MDPGVTLLLPKDQKHFLALSRRRHAELLRQARIFNARARLIGGDPAAWDIQVRDQKIREATEKARDEIFAAEMKHNDKILCMLENREKTDKKNVCQAICKFRQNCQRPETRREFDLSDPRALQKEPPARLSDHDPRNTASGMQKFMGEDLNSHARKKFQEEQNREWLLQQQREGRDARALRKRAEDRYAQTQLQFEATARLLDEQERATSRAICMAVKEFNKSQVAELASRRAREKRQEEEDNAAEICHLLNWDLLTENPLQAATTGGRRRLLLNRWKGMSAPERAHVRDLQQLQIQEKLRLQEEERQRARAWDRLRVQEARDALLEQRQQERRQREARRALDCSNRGLAEEHQRREKAMKEASTNLHSQDYFSQFNTRSR
ncbi:RIB43A-like with coiled-coils protein 2 [Sorex araneus]|uniref:RIB43A-like with coiled-coils protein 2 n=1 Tax=Sorex araneus TaxID=42254 RepID=UPI002433D5D2|nr:RIB43A-like with coiled-coils protein 2 [Sorex araneus]